jgi:hypothetical protein
LVVVSAVTAVARSVLVIPNRDTNSSSLISPAKIPRPLNEPAQNSCEPSDIAASHAAQVTDRRPDIPTRHNRQVAPRKDKPER